MNLILEEKKTTAVLHHRVRTAD